MVYPEFIVDYKAIILKINLPDMSQMKYSTNFTDQMVNSSIRYIWGLFILIINFSRHIILKIIFHFKLSFKLSLITD